MLHDDGKFKNSVTSRSQVRSDLQHSFKHNSQFLGIPLGNMRVKSSRNFLEQPLHIIGPKRRFERDGLVDNTTKGPNIGFPIIGLILPDLRTGIVRRASLSFAHRFANFANIHIP